MLRGDYVDTQGSGVLPAASLVSALLIDDMYSIPVPMEVPMTSEPV